MKIVVAVKVVADDQDIFVAGDRTLDYSKAHQVISSYDKNAIEAAAQLAAANDGTVTVISAATSKATDAKLKKVSSEVKPMERSASTVPLRAFAACVEMPGRAI